MQICHLQDQRSYLVGARMDRTEYMIRALVLSRGSPMLLCKAVNWHQGSGSPAIPAPSGHLRMVTLPVVSTLSTGPFPWERNAVIFARVKRKPNQLPSHHCSLYDPDSLEAVYTQSPVSLLCCVLENTPIGQLLAVLPATCSDQ